MQFVHAPGTHTIGTGKSAFSVAIEPTESLESGLSFRGFFYPSKKIDGQWVVEIPDPQSGYFPMKMPDGSQRSVPLSQNEVIDLAGHGLVPKVFLKGGALLVQEAVREVAGTTNVNDVLAQEMAAREKIAADKAAAAEQPKADADASKAAAPAPAKKKPGEL